MQEKEIAEEMNQGNREESILNFLKDALGKVNTREAYDQFTELHFSGADAGFGKIRDGTGKIIILSETPSNVHARIEGSQMDIYISGRAIEDWKNNFLKPIQGGEGE